MKAEASRSVFLGTALVGLLSFSPAAHACDCHLDTSDKSKAATTDNKPTNADQTRAVDDTSTHHSGACGIDTSRGVKDNTADKPTTAAEQRHDSTINDVSGGTAMAPANQLNNDATDGTRAADATAIDGTIAEPGQEMTLDAGYDPEAEMRAELEMGRYYDAEADLYAGNDLDATRGIEAESTSGSCGVATTDSDATRGVTSDSTATTATTTETTGSCGVSLPQTESSASGVSADTTRAVSQDAFAGTKIVCVPNEQLSSRGADTVAMDSSVNTTSGTALETGSAAADETVLTLNGVRILQFRVPAGSYSPSERWEIVQRRLQQALVADARHRVTVSDLNGSPAIYLGSHLLLTVTEADARANRTSPDRLASHWAANLREAISSISR